MKTIFCLFKDMNAAQTAIDQLLDKRLSKNDMNIIVQANSAKNALELNSRLSNIPVTGTSSAEHDSTLDTLLKGKQPVPVPGSGKVFSVGEIANLLIKTASGSSTGLSGSDLDWALKDFGLPKKTAEIYSNGIKGGALLLFVRTSDENSADVAGILRRQTGENQVTSVG